MHPALKVAGVVHIWYYIPLCTICAQKFNVMFSGPNSIFPNQGRNTQRPFQRRISWLINLEIHGGNQKTIQESQSPGPSGVGLAISFRIIPRAFSEVIHHFNQLSRHQVSQYSLDNSIGPYRHQSINLYVLGPIGQVHIPLWEFNHTAQISRWPDLY
ncbi:hypothetical protein O181_065031 [Austropuccinia psidii MF-1]|uniref:Uncharacterized protein n=1 Tax=Austropuccinia psidii MF-1 TaxID=1389203 RepID=A0A9Q3EN64_9BASI|nr:hypothetical protein [Austropuccinia psidii MF-1]